MDLETKYTQRFKNKYPRLYQKIFHMEDMFYLNNIDRAFYFIRLREDFYRNHQSILGQEYEHNEEEGFKFTVRRNQNSEGELRNEFSWNDFIKQIDRDLLKEISENLTMVKSNYFLFDLDWILSRPTPIIIDNPNLLTISPFLFTLKEWIRIIENDIAKTFGQPLERNEKEKRYLNFEGSVYNKKRLHSIADEIKKRIGTPHIKDYELTYGVVYIKIHQIDLHFLIRNFKIQKEIGTKNENILAKEVQLMDKIKLKERIYFQISNKEIRQIYTYFFKNFFNIEKSTFYEELIYFANFFDPTQDSKIKNLDFPNLSFLKEEDLEDYLVLVKFLKKKSAIKLIYEDFAYFISSTTPIAVTNSQIQKAYRNTKISKDLYRSLNSQLCK